MIDEAHRANTAITDIFAWLITYIIYHLLLDCFLMRLSSLVLHLQFVYVNCVVNFFKLFIFFRILRFRPDFKVLIWATKCQSFRIFSMMLRFNSTLLDVFFFSLFFSLFSKFVCYCSFFILLCARVKLLRWSCSTKLFSRIKFSPWSSVSRRYLLH